MILSRVEEKRLIALRKRYDHLSKRINESPKDLSYDKQEAVAIKWAIEYIENVASREYIRQKELFGNV